MTLPSGVAHETYLSDNLITTISSSSGSDTGELYVEGHTISGTKLTFVEQTVTLDGQNQVSLTTPLARCNRKYRDIEPNLVGAIYAYEDDTDTSGVPDTDAKVHCIIRAGENQSEKAATSVSDFDFWIVTNFTADVFQKTAAFAEVRLERRRVGKAFRPSGGSLAVASGQHETYWFNPYLIIPKNSDVRLTAVGSTTMDVGGTIDGFLAVTI
jgi:hypothetical protein